MATGKIIQADKIQGLADVPNFLSNPNGLLNTSGWTEGSYTAGTRPTGSFTASSGAGKFSISRTTTNPLGVTGTSLVFTKASGNQQGRAVETIFALPLDYRAKVLKLSASYINTSTNATDFVAGSNTTDSDMIFYTAFSTDGGSTYTVAEPSSIKLLSNSKDNSDPFTGSYQTPYNATHLKFIAYVATTSTTAWSIKAVCSVSPSNYVYGTPITDWQSYTPTIGGLGSGSTSANSARYRRVGDSVQIELSFTKDATAGTGVSTVTVSLPNVNVDVSKVSSGGNGFVGVGFSSDTTVSASNLVSSYNESLKSIVFTYGNTVVTGSAVTANSVWRAVITLPILGWSSSVQVSDGYDGRVIAANVFRATGTAFQSIPNNIYTGVGFDTKTFDTTSNWVTSATGNSSYFVVPSAGYYRVAASVTFSGNATNGRVLAISKGSPAGVVEHIATSAGIAAAVTLSGSRTIYANAGELIFISVYQDSGAALNLAQLWNEASIEKLAGNPVISATETVAMIYTKGDATAFNGGAIRSFGTKIIDTHGAYNTSTGYFTAPVSGLYHATVAVQAASVAYSAGGNSRVYFSANGTVVWGAEQVAEANGTFTRQMTASTLVYLLAGQTLGVLTDSSPTVNFVADVTRNRFSVHKVGN